jgi:hypothetical protein
MIIIAGLLIMTGCTGGPSAPSPTSTGSGASPTTAPAAPSATPSLSQPPEPTTTNTLPPPPAPTGPAPKSAGPLTEKDLPVPDGWQPVIAEGGAEEGYQGNGTWVRGRDPRYAARDAISIGCAQITRDDYPDPTAALEGSYGRRGETERRPGIGMVFQFASAQDAKTYYRQYVGQVEACRDPGGPVRADVVDSDLGLIDRRTYAGGAGEWTEVVALEGDRATFVILTDPGHRISRAEAEKLLRSIRS